MKHLLTSAVLVLSLLLAPHLHATSPLSATLTLPHDNVLPGVPFDLVVTYTNVSDKPVTLDSVLGTLVVTFPNGETKVMHQPEANDRWSAAFSPPTQLAPGESVQQGIGWERGAIPNWFFAGSSFSGPGTYSIAVELRITNDDGNILGTIRTPPVTLNRSQPVGIDADLWKRMQELSGSAWSDGSFASTKPGAALANEIIQLHPTSGYYPYVLALRSYGMAVSKDHIPALLEAAERFPGSPAYPYLLNAAAHSARYAGLGAAREGNMAEAQKYYTFAQSKYREALATKSVAIRASSERGLHDVIRGLERATKKAAH